MSLKVAGPLPFSGMLCCARCNGPITAVTLTEALDWVQSQVDRLRCQQAAGEIRSRKQSKNQTDQEVNAGGLEAELAACVVLCPGRLAAWKEAVEKGGNNRGRDLRVDWTGMPKSVEVKYTPYYSWTTGYLLIRPPSGCGAAMCEAFVDDSCYLLLTGKDHRFVLRGWTDRDGFLSCYEVDPVGRSPDQDECWGVLWQRLHPITSLPRPPACTYLQLRAARQSPAPALLRLPQVETIICHSCGCWIPRTEATILRGNVYTSWCPDCAKKRGR